MGEPVTEKCVGPVRHHVAHDLKPGIPCLKRGKPCPECAAHIRSYLTFGIVVHWNRDKRDWNPAHLQLFQKTIEVPFQYRKRLKLKQKPVGGDFIRPQRDTKKILPMRGEAGFEDRTVA